MTSPEQPTIGTRSGVLCALGAYASWGLLPIYWKSLTGVPAMQLLCHRVIWSCLLLAGVIILRRRWKAFRAAVGRRELAVYALAALLIGVNWLTYVWAVGAGFIVECSLGYYVNPLLSVILGVAFLRERLRPAQWASVALAAAGVAWLALSYGRLPWIALTLATTFAVYGLVKKTAPLGALHGLALETGILFVPALAFLIAAGVFGDGAFGRHGAAADLLLAGTGLVTIAPLFLFAEAARRIPLTSIGVLQYVSPTISFLLGVLVYGEPFDHDRLIGFGVVWTALALFAIEGVLARRRTRGQAAS
jgi:chloramphenicol-sensitive protein RarD